jgi:hypothetical protein
VNDREQQDISGQRAWQRQDRLARSVLRCGLRQFWLGFQGLKT